MKYFKFTSLLDNLIFFGQLGKHDVSQGFLTEIRKKLNSYLELGLGFSNDLLEHNLKFQQYPNLHLVPPIHVCLNKVVLELSTLIKTLVNPCLWHSLWWHVVSSFFSVKKWLTCQTRWRTKLLFDDIINICSNISHVSEQLPGLAKCYSGTINNHC